MSNEDIKARIEQILSDILSRKHDCKIVIKFGGRDLDGDNESETIIKK